MQVCKFCQKHYDVKETKRIFGDTWWAGIYCTAQCYTKGRVVTTTINKEIEETTNIKERRSKMGIWDIVEGIETKCTPEPSLKEYHYGDLIPLDDGLYFGTGGWFVIKEGKVLITGETLWDKWGNKHYPMDLVSEWNPILKAIEELEKENKIQKETKT